MVDGQVGFHRPENVRRIQVEKNNFIVNALNKTKVEKFPDLAALQQDRIREMQQEKKQHRREEEKAKKALDLEAKRAKEEFSYDRIMTSDNMTRNSGKIVDFVDYFILLHHIIYCPLF
jgi:LPS O-antigen subunit length determinant protein (WzzB/FepE family)